MAGRRKRYSRNELYRLVLGFVYIAAGANILLAGIHLYLLDGEWLWTLLVLGLVFIINGLIPIFEKVPSDKTFARFIDVVILTVFSLAASLWLLLQYWSVAIAVLIECLLIGRFYFRNCPKGR